MRLISRLFGYFGSLASESARVTCGPCTVSELAFGYLMRYPCLHKVGISRSSLPGPLFQNYTVLDIPMVVPCFYPASGNDSQNYYLYVSNSKDMTAPKGTLSVFHQIIPAATQSRKTLERNGQGNFPTALELQSRAEFYRLFHRGI